MIQQQINLYQERFHEKNLLLSAINSLVLLAVMLVVLAGMTFYLHRQHQQVSQDYQSADSRQQAATRRLEQLQKALQVATQDKTLDNDISELNKAIKVRQQMINFIDGNSFGSGEGFSPRLTVLTELQQKDLWLTQISLDGNNLRIAGSAINAESIPVYFSLFQDREQFRGLSFEFFELGRSKEDDWKVDFMIASKGQQDG